MINNKSVEGVYMKEVVKVEGAKKTDIPISPGIITGNLIFVSGQVSMNLDTGEPVKGDIRTETRQVLENIKRILESAGTSLENVVKTTVFLGDIEDYSAMNEVYGEYFPMNPPARSCFAVGKLAGDYKVEIEAISTK